jgi:hypothetical protein
MGTGRARAGDPGDAQRRRRPEDGGSRGRRPEMRPRRQGLPSSGPPRSRISRLPPRVAGRSEPVEHGRYVTASSVRAGSPVVPVSRPGAVEGRADPADASLRALPQPAGLSKRWGIWHPALTGRLGSPVRAERRRPNPESPATGPQARYRTRSYRGNNAPEGLKVTRCGSQRSKCCALRDFLFDHFVGGSQHRLRDGKAKRLGGLEVDH